jgi:AP-4 complex subunit mu-1
MHRILGSFLLNAGSVGVILDDCSFHEGFNLEEFENDRVLSIIPPDGEVRLLVGW